MADADDVRQLALGLPHVQEIDSDGFDFRVAGKGFVWSYPERRPGKPRLIRTDIAVLFVGDEAEKQALLLGEPEAFFTTPGYDGWPLVMLRLAQVDLARLTELVTDAWRMRASDALVGDLDEASDVSTQITANRARPADSPPASRLPHLYGSNTKINGRVTVQNDGYERTCLGNSAHDAMVNNVLASQPGKLHILIKAHEPSAAWRVHIPGTASNAYALSGVTESFNHGQ